MLSDREQRVLDELERNYRAEAAQPPPRPWPRPRRGRWRRGARGRDRLRASVAVVVAVWISLMLLISGAPAIAAAAGLGWLLWRCWPALKTANRGAGPRGVETAHAEGRPQLRRTRKRQGRPRPLERIAEAE